MLLLDLPNELLEVIAAHVDSTKDLLSLLRANHHLHNLLISKLYIQNPEWLWNAFYWAAGHGRLDILLRAQEHSGCDIKHAFGLINDAAAGGHVKVLEYLLNEGVTGLDFVNCSDDLAETPLVGAARHGHAKAVQFLLKHQVRIDVLSSEGYSALHYAVKKGFVETAKILLKHGANAFVPMPDGKVALHTACEAGSVEMVRVLVENGGFDNSIRSGTGWTALHFAAHEGATDIAKLLIEHGASPGERDNYGGTALHWAASRGHNDTCRVLIEHGAKVSAEDETGLTPLDTVMRCGDVSLVKMFLDEGDGSLEPDEGGMTPLHTAVMAGNTVIVKMLVERGSEVSARSQSGYTPLYTACLGGDVEVIKLLLSKGAAVDVSTNDRISPLHAACKRKTSEVAQLLLEKGANVHVQDEAGQTPLHFACQMGCLDTIKLLVANDADVTAVARGTGATPLNVALQHGRAETAMYLLEKTDMYIDTPDAVGRTPLFHAARCGLVDVMEALLARKAQLNALDHYNAGPLIAASRSGHLKAVELLLENENGECLRHKDNTGHTAVWWAARSGNCDLFNFFRAHAKKTGVKIWRSDRMTDDDLDNTLPAFEAGFCFCDICTLSVPWANWPRICTLCCGGRFVICDDCYEAEFHCLDDKHRDQPNTWQHSVEHCECKQHYPHTKRYVAEPEMAPDLRGSRNFDQV